MHFIWPSLWLSVFSLAIACGQKRNGMNAEDADYDQYVLEAQKAEESGDLQKSLQLKKNCMTFLRKDIPPSFVSRLPPLMLKRSS